MKIIEIPALELLEWIKEKIADAGYDDRELLAVQINVVPHDDTVRIHGMRLPALAITVSDVPT